MAKLRGVYKALIAGGVAAAAIGAVVPLAYEYFTNPVLSQDTVVIRATPSGDAFDIFVRNRSSEPLDLVEVRLVAKGPPRIESKELLAQLEGAGTAPDYLRAAPSTTAVYSVEGEKARMQLIQTDNGMVVIVPVLQAIESGEQDRFVVRHDGIAAEFSSVTLVDIYGDSFDAVIGR